MRGLFGLFAKSPWKPLLEHMKKSWECIELVRPITDAFLAGDMEGVDKYFKQITKLEHEADMIKDQIRDTMPKSLFMSVDRRDFLNLLAAQDGIPDLVEDLAMVYNLRQTTIPEVLRPQFTELVDSVLNVVEWAHKVLEELDTLVEASFAGKPRETVYKLIDEIGKLEHDADKTAYRFAKEMYKHEDQMSPVDIMMITKIERTLSALANAAEKVCKRIRLMIAQ